MKLVRKTAKLFGENASPANDATAQGPEIGQFGSAKAGEYIGTADIMAIQALAAWQNGFIGAVTPDKQYPPLPEMTGFGKVLSYQNCYLLQMGLAEWDNGTTYYANSFCQKNGIVYISNTNGNINNDPVNDRVNWRIFENGGRSHNLFDIVIKDHVLSYDDTYGFTMQGDYAYKEATLGVRYGYPDFYNKCIAEMQAGTETRITLGSSQIDVYINSNGHTYYNIADKEVIDTYFTANGVAWYYGVDTENERICMPRNIYFFRNATSSPGGINYPGLPIMSHKHSKGDMRIEGTMFGQRDVAAIWENVTGAFSKGDGGKRGNEGSDTGNFNVNFRAQDNWKGKTSTPTDVSPDIYGRQTNQVMITSTNGILYICTGNTVDDHAITINASLANAIETLETQEQTCIGNIEDAKDDAISDLDDAKDAAIEEIEEETADVIQQATDQANRAESEADRAEEAAQTAVAGQMQANWTENDSTKVDYIKNKPTDLVTETATQTLENKTISGSDNTITNIGASSISVLTGTIRDINSASSLLIPTELATAVALNTLAGIETIQNIVTVSGGAVNLVSDKVLYSSTPTGSTTYTFTLPGGTVTGTQAFTFELYVNMSTTAYSLTFPNSVTWQGGTAPDMSSTGKYFLAFRTMDGGSTWLGNLQGVW